MQEVRKEINRRSAAAASGNKGNRTSSTQDSGNGFFAVDDDAVGIVNDTVADQEFLG